MSGQRMSRGLSSLSHSARWATLSDRPMNTAALRDIAAPLRYAQALDRYTLFSTIALPLYLVESSSTRINYGPSISTVEG